jgi:prevent-host-death family protein
MVNIHEAKTHFSRLVQRAAAGEEIVIAKAGVPLAKLVPYDEPRKLIPGLLKGKVWMADDWDSDETNAEIAKLFLGAATTSRSSGTSGRCRPG